MAIEQREWQVEIGRGNTSDPTTWDAVDTARAGEAVHVVGSRERGAEQSFAAIYPLKDGRWCFYRSTPGGNGRGWVVSPDPADCRNEARRRGEAVRLGISDAIEARAETP